MSTREEILRRVRAATTAAEQVDAPKQPVGDPLAGHDAEWCRERFADRIRDYRALIDLVDDDGLPAAVAAACPPSGDLLVPPGLPAPWLTGLDPARLVIDDAGLAAADLDRLACVVTGCAVAIAESGTIVLDGARGQGRRAASLIPDRHVCIVRTDQLVPSVPAAVARLDATAPLTWISGGSATSDIELNRVEGVHGPRHLHVLLVA